MASVPGSEVLSFEHVSQMSATPSALDLGSRTIGVGEPANAARDLLVKAWPTTARIELGVRPVKRGPASPALIRSSRGGVLVLTGERRLGSLAHDHALFLSRELPPLGRGRVRHGQAYPCGLINPAPRSSE
jgi:hypothetical protein